MLVCLCLVHSFVNQKLGQQIFTQPKEFKGSYLIANAYAQIATAVFYGAIQGMYQPQELNYEVALTYTLIGFQVFLLCWSNVETQKIVKSRLFLRFQKLYLDETKSKSEDKEEEQQLGSSRRTYSISKSQCSKGESEDLLCNRAVGSQREKID